MSSEIAIFLIALTRYAGDAAARVAMEEGLRKVGGVFSRARNARAERAAATGDAQRIAVEDERLDETMSVLKADFEQLAPENLDWSALGTEASEPAFERFVEDAFAQSAETSIPSKRLLLGKMIAARLLVKTDSLEERSLRRAMDMLRDLTEEQLKLLGAALLVQNLPIGDEHATTPFASRDEAETWLRDNVFSAASRLKNTSYWERDDFEALASLGCIRIPTPDSSPEYLVGGRTTSVDQWLALHGVSPYDGIEGELGSKESQELFRKRFPTICVLNDLIGGKLTRAKSRMLWAWPLDTIILTPIGEAIGISVLGQLAGGH